MLIATVERHQKKLGTCHYYQVSYFGYFPWVKLAIAGYKFKAINNKNEKEKKPDRLRGVLSPPCCSIQATANHRLLK